MAYSEVQIYPCSLKDGKFLQGWDYNLLLSFSTKSIPLLNDFNSFVKCWHQVRRRQWHPTPVLLPGKSHGRRSLVGCSPWGCEESGTTERLHFHFSLSYTGEGNGNPLQCSCLENPMDGGAWWAAVYGAAQSRTRLKWLSSSSCHQGRTIKWKEKNQLHFFPKDQVLIPHICKNCFNA